MGTGDLCRVPPAADIPGEPDNVQGRDRVGCRRVLWGPYSEKPGVQDEGVRHVAKRSSDPRVAYPEVNVQVTSASCGYCCPLCPAGVQYSGEIRFIDRTSKKQYTRSLVLPSWRHETWSGALCEGIIHTFRIELCVGALCEGSSMRTCWYA